MNLTNWKPQDLEDGSGVKLAKFTQETGYHRVPVVKFGNTRYALLDTDPPHPGHNRAEVINLTERDNGQFPTVISHGQQVMHTEGFAWVRIDEAISLLTVYTKTGELHEYFDPFTAVLSYRITPPTMDDVRAVVDELDDDLQQGWSSYRPM
jgi:hypothetical protein